VVTASGGSVRGWSAADGEALTTFEYEAEINSIAFSPDGARLLVAASSAPSRASIRLFDARTGEELVRLSDDHAQTGAVFSPDGKSLFTASGAMARIWETATGQELARFAHRRPVSNAAFSPDGTRLVTASEDNTARLSDAASGTELVRLVHNPSNWGVQSAMFSPNGSRVLTASDDNMARIWETVSGKEIARLVGHVSRVETATFSPDGGRVLTTSSDATARVWDVTWAAKLDGDALVRAVARHRLVGEGRLTDEELLILRPILGEIDSDVVSRWLAPSPDPKEEAKIEAALDQWRRQCQRALALARNDWIARADEITADLAKSQAETKASAN
jgi:dipeptidyl aminopeptidase/acylaminoacyl peptidase